MKISTYSKFALLEKDSRQTKLMEVDREAFRKLCEERDRLKRAFGTSLKALVEAESELRKGRDLGARQCVVHGLEQLKKRGLV